jgi:hypothetical protein
MRVAVINAATEDSLASAVVEALSRVGLVFDSPSRGIDVAIVFVSEGALADVHWQRSVAELSSVRVIPIRVGDVSANDMPPLIQAVQWIQFEPENTAAFLGGVVAALDRDSDLHRWLNMLESGAEAWLNGSQRESLLISDYGRATDASTQLTRLIDEPHLRPADLVYRFVAMSVEYSKKLRTRRRRLRLMVVGALVVALGLGTVFVPQLRQLVRGGNASFVLLPDSTITRDAPDWQAMLAGASIVEAGPTSANMARHLLALVMSRPMEIGALLVPSGYSLEAIEPLDSGDRAAVILGSRESAWLFGIYDLKSNQYERSIPLPASFWTVDVDRSEQRFVLAGEGLAVIDVETGSLDHVATDERFDRLVATGESAYAVSFDGSFAQLDVKSLEIRKSSLEGDFISIAATSGGQPSADFDVRVVMLQNDQYVMLDPISGRSIVSADATGVSFPAAGVISDGAGMVVVGRSGALEIISDESVIPTGIAVPTITDEIVSLGNGRVAIGSDVDPVSIWHLPTASLLGTMCVSGSGFVTLSQSSDQQKIGCLLRSMGMVWNIPAGPLDNQPSGFATSLTDVAAQTTAEVEGNVMTITTAEGRLERLAPSEAAITAVAVSPSGRDVLVGTTSGDVFIYTLHATETIATSKWRLPGGAAVEAVGWSDGPVALGEDDLSWKVPWCVHCSSDQDMLEGLSEMLRRCWEPEQLHWVEKSTRNRLEIDSCEPSINPAES